MEIKITTIPKKDTYESFALRMKAIIEDRNKSIAKRFSVEPLSLEARFYYSKGALSSYMEANKDAFGVFAVYKENLDQIHFVHPETTAPIFGTNLDKQYLILIDYNLVRFYCCKLFYWPPVMYDLSYSYISESLAKIVSGNFQDSIVKTLIKTYSETRKYSKEQEILMVMWIMFQKSGIDYLFEHLKLIFSEKDIKKTVFTIYKKSFSDLVTVIQKEIEEEEKKIKLAYAKTRRAPSTNTNPSTLNSTNPTSNQNNQSKYSYSKPENTNTNKNNINTTENNNKEHFNDTKEQNSKYSYSVKKN